MFRMRKRRRRQRDKPVEEILNPAVGPPYTCGAKYWLYSMNKEFKEYLAREKIKNMKKDDKRQLYYKGLRILEYKREPIGMGFIITLENDEIKRISFKAFLENVEDKSKLDRKI